MKMKQRLLALQVMSVRQCCSRSKFTTIARLLRKYSFLGLECILPLRVCTELERRNWWRRDRSIPKGSLPGLSRRHRRGSGALVA